MMKAKISGVVLAVLAVTGAWCIPNVLANMSEQDVRHLVQQEYPGAVIRHVEHEYDDGYKVCEVHFCTDSIKDGELTIDEETGRIIERDIAYDRHGHGRHHTSCR